VKEKRYYDFYSPDGFLAGSIWADEITTMQSRPDDPYSTTFGTSFHRDGIRLCTIWSDCLSWRTAR